MKKLTELLSDTLIYGISSVGARFLNYLLVPFYTKVFAPGAYGVVGLVYSAIGFLNILFQFGMESAYLRYAADRDKAPHVFKTLELGVIGISSVLAIVVWLLKPWAMPYLGLDAGTHQLYDLMIAVLWFDAVGIVPFAELRLNRQPLVFASVKLFHVLVNLALNFYLVLGVNWGLMAVFFSNMIASLVATLIVLGFTFRLWRGSFSNNILQTALKFGIPFVPTGIGYAINEFLDRFFLNSMDPENVTAIYGAGYTPEGITGIYNACYKLAIFMPLLVQMFRMAWQPFFLRHADNPEAKGLFAEVFRFYNMASALLFLLLALFAEYIVQIRIPVLDATIIDQRYWMGLKVVPLLLLAYWFQGWYTNFTAGVFIREKTRYLPQITLMGAAITIAANLVLVPYLGMMGSAFATLMSYSSMAIMLYLHNRKIYPVRYPFRRVLPIMGFSLLIYLLDYYLFPEGLLGISSGYVTAILFLVGVAGVFVLGLTDRKALSQLKQVIANR